MRKQVLSIKIFIQYSWLILFSIFLISISACKSDSFKLVPKPISASIETINNVAVLKGPSVFINENRLIWGASVVEGKNGLYHMIFSTWDSGPDNLKFGDSWVLNSEIGYAVSNYPDREFKFKKIILRGRRFDGDSTAWDAQMVHNPHIKKFNNKYYLYYIGSVDPGPQPDGSPGEALNKRNRVQQNQKIAVIEFENFSDLLNQNFNRPNRPLLTPRTRVKKDNIIDPSPKGTIAGPDNIIVVNPSVTYSPSNKKYYLYFKGNWYDPGWRGVHGVALSDSPTGPFTTMDDIIFNIRMADGRVASAEDPYVWYYKKYKCFYAIVKDFSGQLTKEEPGLAILKSRDGLNWEQPYNSLFLKKEIMLNNEDFVIKLNHLERPQLLLDKDGTPLVFYGACSIESLNDKTNTGTFNIHIDLAADKNNNL